MNSYTKPEIRDYGNLRELTAAVDNNGGEDSINKFQAPHHT